MSSCQSIQMSLVNLRLLCVAASSISLHLASTAPNPPLRSEERITKPTHVEKILGSWFLRTAQTTLFWVLMVAEGVATTNHLARPESGLLNMALGVVFMVGGASLRRWCYHELGQQFTFELGLLKDHQLITTGPYRFVRHPSYAAALLVYFGLFVASPGSWVMDGFFRSSISGRLLGSLYMCFVLFVITGLVLRIPKEDASLKEKFGEEWDHWAAKTYALIPGMF
ncbi:hypothetical protein MIND_01185200 [Mycena indigotica]|uniref:Protein-S-isoprenylcysteine O-methyltransferase n=1 Tax=Mycena indigotica TaxID=2126181 RepID=A0A8H6VSZ4_9AGAR|nr:uncharacterized protein MIND_01185200 [Mycena indigotica]KAF7292862.1 hypothetical protein MIND_01185200 [Mycena indigotica]